jgi:hypothetical protein
MILTTTPPPFGLPTTFEHERHPQWVSLRVRSHRWYTPFETTPTEAEDSGEQPPSGHKRCAHLLFSFLMQGGRQMDGLLISLVFLANEKGPTLPFHFRCNKGRVERNPPHFFYEMTRLKPPRHVEEWKFKATRRF